VEIINEFLGLCTLLQVSHARLGPLVQRGLFGDIITQKGDAASMADGCRVAQVLRSQLTQATLHQQQLLSERASTIDRKSIARLDREIATDRDTIERFEAALKLHRVIDGCF
jgi:hypothetical protein